MGNLGERRRTARGRTNLEDVHIQLLGPVRVTVDDRTVELGRSQQSLIAALAVEPGRVVERERLVEAVWGKKKPPDGSNALQQHVYRLRQAIKNITTHGDDYVLEVDPSRIDLHRFRQLVADARSIDDDAVADRLFRAALALWRGDPFAELPRTPLWDGIRAGLQEEYLSAVEDSLERRQKLGTLDQAQLDELVREHPHRDRLAALKRKPQGQPTRTHLVPRQLPAALRDFTGREKHLAALRECGSMVITAIDGAGGIGKTALAVRFAHDVAHDYPDGQFYVNLHGFDPGTTPMAPGDALCMFLRAMGITAQRIPPGLAEQSELFRGLLHGRRALLVLDNAVSVEQVRPLLPRGDSCLVLVTSRNQLGELEFGRLFLDRMDPDEAIELLRKLVGEPGETAHELVELCGYLPLAIRIAAANVTTTVADVVAELRENRLGALAIDDDEQLAIRTTFDLSYRSLTTAHQRLFRRLGLVPGPDFTAEATAQLDDTDLRGLVTANLVERHGDRYQLHDLLRLYARELVTREDEQARDRLLHWYARKADNAARLIQPDNSVLDPAEPGEFDAGDEALRWLEAESANLVAAAHHAAETGPREVAWRLADSLHGFFMKRRARADWLAVGLAGLDAARHDQHIRGQAAAHSTVAHARWSVGQLSEALHHGRRALELAERDEWGRGTISFLRVLGDIYREIGDMSATVACYERSIAIMRAAGDRREEHRVMGQIGTSYWMQGRLREALDYLERALRLGIEAGDQQAVGLRWGQTAVTLRDLGRLDRAEEYLAKAMEIIPRVGLRAAESYLLDDASMLARARGRWAEAVECAEQAMTIARELADPAAESDALNNLGAVLARTNDPAAVGHLRRSVTITQRIGYRHGEAQALIWLGKATDHVDHVHQALAIARRAGYGLLEGLAVTTLAELHLKRNEMDLAVSFGTEALALHRRSGNRLDEVRALTVLGHNDSAHWRAALEICTEVGMPEADELRALLAGEAGR